MEALGSPTISRARWAGAMLSENRKLRYAGNRYNDIHYRSLPEIHFTASGFFLKTFDCLCLFVFVSFWSFFFANLHIMKSRKNKTKKKQKTKKNIQITTIYMMYKPVKQTHYCVKVFLIITRKECTVYTLSKHVHQSVPYAQNKACLAKKETENG